MATALLENEINYMRCFLCDNFLSIPPIKTLSADGTENQCGRCKAIKFEGSTRNLCFENLAKHLSFPCIYKNCQENVLWSEVEEHEKTCPHKSIQCPFYYQQNCKEQVEIAEFERHVKTKHSTKIFDGGVLEKEIEMHSSTVNLMKSFDKKFIVYILENQIFVGSLGPIETFNKFNVLISSNDFKDQSISYQNQDMVEFDERLHCYKCQMGLCSLKHHLFSTVNTKTPHRHSLVINRNIISEFFLNSPTIKICVSLICEDLDAFPDVIEKFVHNSNIICRHLQCIACMKYMVGEVYNCRSGHLICHRCKLSLKICPTCKVKLGEMRCRLAEVLSRDIDVACAAEDCNFIGNLERLAFHERSCIGPID